MSISAIVKVHMVDGEVHVHGPDYARDRYYGPSYSCEPGFVVVNEWNASTAYPAPQVVKVTRENVEPKLRAQ